MGSKQGGLDKVTCNSDFAESAKKISIDFALIFGQAVSGELEGFRERT